MQFTSDRGEQRYAALVQVASRSVIGLDFDGVLSPIVADPARARIHPGAADVLGGLAREVAAVAVITGRPARQALDLGSLEALGTEVERVGSELFLFGQYGNERWSSTRRRVVSPPPPPGYATYLRELPDALRRADAAAAYVEDKGLAVAVHTRRLPDPDAAYERLQPVLRDLAGRHGLEVEPGRQVVEVRAGGMHKGLAVEHLVAELDAAGFLYAGDDLGDLPAFDAVDRLAREGAVAPLLVCSASAEQHALVPRADLVVAGPDGVLDLLRRLTADARALRT